MSRNGSGVYTLPSNSFNPAVADTEIDADAWNDTGADLATALTESIASTGVTTTTASIPFAAGVTINNTGLKVYDTNASHTLAIVPGSNLTSNRTLTLTTGDANRGVSLGGDLTLAGSLTSSGAFPITLTVDAATSLALPNSFGSGIRTFLSVPSSANLASAVTGETGSGALVFATSPTLVTPALGTPSSATLTNATGLPISTGVSGLGTGVATLLSGTSSGTGGPAGTASPTFSGSITVSTSGTNPAIWRYTSGGTDEKEWRWSNAGNSLSLLPYDDSGTPNTNALQITRSGILFQTFSVGQGQTNPAFKVDGSAASSATGLQITAAAAAGGVAVAAISSGTNESLTIDAKGTGTIRLGATSTGAVILSRATFINATAQLSEVAQTLIAVDGSTTNGLNINDTSATNTAIFEGFYSNGSRIGQITNNNNTGVTYGTTSDRRLKTDIADSSEAGAVIDALRVRQWTWKSNGSFERWGFVAQEEYEVAPFAVVKGDDNPDKIESQWGRDDSKLVPLLVKELQSLRQRVAELERTCVRQ